MNKFTKICCAAGGIMMAVGIIFVIVGSAIGVTSTTYGNINRRLSRFFNSYQTSDYTDSKEVMEDTVAYGGADYGTIDGSGYSYYRTYYYSAKDIKNLDLTAKSGSVDIYTYDGDDIMIEVARDSSDNLTIEENEEDGTLKIADNRSNKDGMYDTFDSYMHIYIPYDFEFKNAAFDIGSGYLYMEDLEIRNDLTIKISAGYANIGQVDVGKTTTLKVGAGGFSSDYLDTRNLIVDCGAGYVNLSGYTSGDVKTKCGAGYVDLNLNNDEDDFNYNIQVDLGYVQVNGSSYTSLGNTRKIDNGAVQKMEIECSIGSVSVYMY